MLVKEFVQMEKSGSMFQLVDASKIGYMTYPSVIDIVGRSVAVERYGDYEVVGFSPHSKRAIDLYIK